MILIPGSGTGACSRNFAYFGDAQGDLFWEIENIFGSAHGGALTGDHGVNTLAGSGGDDTLEGLNGDDTLFGGGAATSLPLTVLSNSLPHRSSGVVSLASVSKISISEPLASA
jgi:hypothetical protein